MSEEFSISNNRKKRSQRDETGNSALDELRDLDRGETAWAIDQEHAESAEKGRKDEDDFSGFPNMPGFAEEEEPAKPSSLDLFRLIYGVWERRFLVVVIAVTITSIFVVLAFTLMHHSWTARAVLIKKEHIDEFQFSNTPYKPQKYSMKTMLDTLRLRTVLEQTLEASKVDALPKVLGQQISVLQGKDTDIFGISVRWDDPIIATTLTNNLADAFIEYNRSMRRADAEGVYHYYGGQLDSAEQQLKKIDEEVLAFQHSNGVVNFDSQIQVMLAQVAELEAEYRSVATELEAERETLSRVEATLADTPEMIVSLSTYRNPLQKKLGELEWELEQIKGRYTSKNPKVIDLQGQINKIKGLIEEGKDDAAPENTLELNPMKQELELKRMELQDSIRLKQANVDSMKQSIDVSNARLTEMTAKQKEFYELTAEQDSIREVLINLRNKVEEARISMLSGQGDFDYVEHAQIPDLPEASGRKVFAIAGVVLGSGFGVFLALLLEFLSPQVRTRKEVVGITETELTFEFQRVPDNEQIVIDTRVPGENVTLIFRRMANDLLSQVPEDVLQSVAFVSAERNSGTSLVITNLAQVFSLKESRCLLVDADLAPGAGIRLADYYNINAKAGLNEVLDEQRDLAAATHQTVSPNVYLLPAFVDDAIPADADLKLGSRRMSALITKLKEFGGHVFYDLPPLSKYETAYEAVARTGHAILIVRSGYTSKKDLKIIAERLRASGVEIHAAIITDVPKGLMKGPLQFSKKGDK